MKKPKKKRNLVICDHHGNDFCNDCAHEKPHVPIEDEGMCTEICPCGAGVGTTDVHCIPVSKKAKNHE